MFDRRIRFSGLWFSNSSTTFNSANWFYTMIEQGTSLPTWKSEKAHVATYTASLPLQFLQYGSHALPGEIDDLIAKQKGRTILHLSFRGDELTATVNKSAPIQESNSLYAGKKYLMGFIVGDQDEFVVKDLRVWTVNNGNFQIVNVARAIFQNMAVLSNFSPAPATTIAPAELTPASQPIIDTYVGNWRPIKAEMRWAYFGITKQGNTLFVHLFGMCGPAGEVLCDDGIAFVTFEGEPVVLDVDWQDEVMRLILQRDGKVLHVTDCIVNVSTSIDIPRCDLFSTDFVRK